MPPPNASKRQASWLFWRINWRALVVLAGFGKRVPVAAKAPPFRNWRLSM